MAIYSGFSHEKWWFSIAMLVHQRVLLWPVLGPPWHRFSRHSSTLMRATSKVNLIHPNIYKWINQIIMIILIPHINPQFHIVVGWTPIPIPIDWFYSLYFTIKIASIVSQLCQWVAPRSAVLRLHQPGAPWEMRSSPNVRTCALYIIIYIYIIYIIYIYIINILYNIYIYVCMYACMHACMHACMYVCIHILYMYVYTLYIYYIHYIYIYIIHTYYVYYVYIYIKHIYI